VPTVVDVEINLALAASDALNVIEEPAGITNPLVVIGVVPSKGEAHGRERRAAVRLHDGLIDASRHGELCDRNPSWCETNLPHASTLTPSVIEPSAFGCWDMLDRFRCV